MNSSRGAASETVDVLEHNLAAVRSTIADACARVGRATESVTLVAVTKSVSPEVIQRLYALGCRDFGESRPQQLAQRAQLLPADVRWHLIGHLQRNKVDLVLPHVAAIHSVDSLRLLERIAASAKTLSQPPKILLEVNVSGEAQKDGFPPTELREVWPQIRALSLPVCGLMTMAPLYADPEQARPVFAGLRKLRDELGPRAAGYDLSMGMSGDYTVAIEEGATIVRVGSRLFEGV